ncbi:MAG: hypothetical protein QNK05_05975 [Myxococcota bacterium]|nr:hypothetical protein [Myxococcota bacterium]
MLGSLSYAIDGSDLLADLGVGWDEFALRNDAPELAAERVVGLPIWGFIHGEETREVYRRLFEWVRASDARIAVPFRCDSPDLFRFMRLELSAGGDGRIAIQSVLELEKPRRHLSLLDRAVGRSEEELPACSFCKRVLAQGRWSEPEVALAATGWAACAHPPLTREVVCEQCQLMAKGLSRSEA